MGGQTSCEHLLSARKACYSKRAASLVFIFAIIVILAFSSRSSAGDKLPHLPHFIAPSEHPLTALSMFVLCPEQRRVATSVIARWTDADSKFANAEACTTFGRNFPSLGGPGCPCPCENNTVSAATSYKLADHKWPPELSANMLRARNILLDFGPLRSSDISERENKLHMALSYHCCVPAEQLLDVKRVVDKFSWNALNLRMSRVVCAVSGITGGQPTVVSIVLLPDEASSVLLEQETARFEAKLAKHGVTHVAHTSLQEHHITLATVDGDTFPCMKAIAAVNEQIKEWHPASDPVVVKQASCNKCNKAAKAKARDEEEAQRAGKPDVPDP